MGEQPVPETAALATPVKGHGQTSTEHYDPVDPNVKQLCYQGPGSFNRETPLFSSLVYVGSSLKLLVSHWPHVQDHAVGNHSQPHSVGAIRPAFLESERSQMRGLKGLIRDGPIVHAQSYCIGFDHLVIKTVVFGQLHGKNAFAHARRRDISQRDLRCSFLIAP